MRVRPSVGRSVRRLVGPSVTFFYQNDGNWCQMMNIIKINQKWKIASSLKDPSLACWALFCFCCFRLCLLNNSPYNSLSLSVSLSPSVGPLVRLWVTLSRKKTESRYMNIQFCNDEIIRNIVRWPIIGQMGPVRRLCGRHSCAPSNIFVLETIETVGR